MLKGLNIVSKFISESVNITAHKIECKECGHSGFVSPRRGKIPTCPKCSGMNGIEYSEVLKETIGVDGYSDTHHNMILTDGTILELQHSEKMGKQMGRLNTTGVGILECVYKIFSGEEKPAVTKEEADKEKKRTQEIFSAAKSAPKSSSKRKTAITDDDLDFIMKKIEVSFDINEKFKNKDLAPLVEERFSARQTPSRLKRMVDAGMLECDSASPKNYWRI